MIKAIFRKVFIDYRRSLIAYSLIFIFYGALMIGFYPSIREKSDEFNTLLQAYPEAMREGFNFSAESFSTLEGYLGVEYLGMIWPLLIFVLAISLGSALIAGEIDKGTADYSFALPIRRWKLILSRSLAAWLILLLVTFINLAAIIIGFYFINETPDFGNFGLLFALSSIFVFFAIAASAFISSLLNAKSKMFMITGGFLAVSYILDIVSKLTDKAKFLSWISFFKYFGDPAKILLNSEWSWRNAIVLFASGVVLLIASLLIVEKRDIR